MRRRKLPLILAGALLLLILAPVAFWLWPVPLPPIQAYRVAEITFPYSETENFHITDRQQISRIVEGCNKVTLRRYLPGYEGELSTRELIFWDAEGRELRRWTVYSPVAGYQVARDVEGYRVAFTQVLVIDDFLWQVRNGGLDFLFEELQLLASSNRDAIY